MRLEGKTAVVTGGTSGIGLETARLFLREGARVLVTGQDEARLCAAEQELRKWGSQAIAVRARSEHRADDALLAKRVAEAFGSLDILFLNAGITTPRPFLETTEAMLDHELAVNFKGPFFTVQALAPLLKRGSSVIFNTSCLDGMGVAGTSAYSASKAALRSLVRTLARELIPLGVRVNSVAPGPIRTPNLDKLGLSEEQLAKITSPVPMGRLGEPADVARAVLFLAGESSGFILGEEIYVDGGWSNL
ncbi:MAG TPA: SDR family oxidoreductase [Bdellovibrionota bacterium]|jgi:NAD(P)-dependent dehydrogenase (short-subunit alcohol dehydrogenase family)